jgi:hypothetical protein
MTDHDKSKSDGASRFDQTIGFIGAVAFLALLVYTQSQN